MTRYALGLAVLAIWLAPSLARADPFIDALAAYDQRDYVAAHQLLEPLAERGDWRAAVLVGGDYLVGLGVPASYIRMQRWLGAAKAAGVPADAQYAIERWRKMAEAGDPNGELLMGWVSATGLGMPVDLGEGMRRIQVAADNGNVRAKAVLGLAYRDGTGVRRSTREAVKWLTLAADQGDEMAQYNVALMCRAGRGMPKDGAVAANWLRKSADQGNSDAANSLGVMYENGEGVASNWAEAMKWYRVAAIAGNPMAQHNLGIGYQRGRAISEDRAEAFKWLALASAAHNDEGFQRSVESSLAQAQAGLSESQMRVALFALGEQLRDGRDKPRDPVLAYAFMDRSLQGETETVVRDARRKARDELALQMAPHQVRNAQYWSRMGKW
jgi:TPR repeat protein